MRHLVSSVLWLALAAVAIAACDDTPQDVLSREPDVCAELVEKVKEQCGADSAAYAKQKQLFIDAAPTGEPANDTDAAYRARRLLACKAGLAAANEPTDYSKVPDFTVGDSDPALQAHAEAAKKHWYERKAAYENMSASDKAKDVASQLQQRCSLWRLG